MRHIWEEERCIQGFGGETWGERDNLEDPGMDRRVILILIFKKWKEGGALNGLIWLRILVGSGPF